MTTAALQTDFYKFFHKSAMLPSIDSMYENFTSRSNKHSNVPENAEVVFVGLQYFILDYLIKEWNETFFEVPKSIAIKRIKRIADNCLHMDYDVAHFEALHDLGYLPLSIKALPEGSLVPYQVTPVTFRDTKTDKGNFAWLPGFIESVLSNENYPIQTSATTAFAYFRQFHKMAAEAGIDPRNIPYLGHDFSFRGMFGRHAGAMSGFGHLAAGFYGTDTVAGIEFAEKYYGADVEKEMVGCSVPATEHSVVTSAIQIMMQEFGVDNLTAEMLYIIRLLDTVQMGILSHVSDSYDFWGVVTKVLPELKEKIMARDGTFVVRPDTGNPADVLCGLKGVMQATDGNWYAAESWTTDGGGYDMLRDGAEPIPECEVKGLIECLWDTFGGTVNEKGFKVLDSHIGAIYGDSITLERQKEIHDRLMAKGFAPTVVLGIGSFTYQYVTRDTHGSAVKATHATYNGEPIDVFKAPKTDMSKKSAKGYIRVERENGKFVQYDEQTVEQEQQGELREVFRDGRLLVRTSLAEIRERLSKEI